MSKFTLCISVISYAQLIIIDIYIPLYGNVLKVLVEKFSKPTLLKYCFLNDWKSYGKTKITVRIQTMWLYIDVFYLI